VSGSETATSAASARRRLARPALVLASLVLVSTAVRLAAAQAFTTPWIAPDEMVYGLIGESLWADGTLTVRGLPSPYYSVLTPALVGLPLAALDLESGIQVARALQALAMSLVAVPTYLWARRLAPAPWALAAAVLVLATPAFHYSGFLMTEPLTLTVVTMALLALAQALEQPSTWRYGVFVAWATAAAAVRLQALVLLPVFLVAALLDAFAARDRARLRPLLWFGALAAAVTGAGAGILVLLGGELSSRRLLGAYTPLGEETPVAAGRLGQLAWHAFDLGVLGVGVCALATGAIVFRSLSGRDRDPALRAFAAVTLAYLAVLVLQVALFAAAYVGHVAERYLVTAVPLLSIGLCAWLARGAPRTAVAVVPLALALVLAAAFVPLSQIAALDTLVNSPTPAALRAFAPDDARVVVVGLACVAALVVLFVPRGVAWLTAVAAAVGVALALLSVDSARRIADASAHENRVALGSEGTGWLDAAGLEDATLLVTSDRLWTATARTVFWNRAIRDAVRLVPAKPPFPPHLPPVDVDEAGVVRTADGEPLERRLVVAPSTYTLAGEKVAERLAGDSETYGLAAWRVDGPVKVVLRVEGILPNGDFGGTASVTVYGCRRGTLDVTILGKTGDPVDARIDGITIARLETPPETAVTHRIPAPPYADGARTCVFELANPGYAGSTTIAFAPR
jgi:hypothetical protein